MAFSFGSTPSTGSGFSFGGASTTPATSGFGGFGSTTSTTTPATTGFGGFGGFGASTAASAPSTGFGGFGSTAASQPASTGFGFGSTTTTTPATGGFGGFGTAASQPATSGFGGFGSTTSTAPASGGFGGFGGFGASSSASTGGGLFGSGAFGSTTSTATTAALPTMGGFGGLGGLSGFGSTPAAAPAAAPTQLSATTRYSELPESVRGELLALEQHISAQATLRDEIAAHAVRVGDGQSGVSASAVASLARRVASLQVSLEQQLHSLAGLAESVQTDSRGADMCARAWQKALHPSAGGLQENVYLPSSYHWAKLAEFNNSMERIKREIGELDEYLAASEQQQRQQNPKGKPQSAWGCE